LGETLSPWSWLGGGVPGAHLDFTRKRKSTYAKKDVCGGEEPNMTAEGRGGLSNEKRGERAVPVTQNPRGGTFLGGKKPLQG